MHNDLLRNLTEQEAAQYLGISVATLRRWRWVGSPTLPFVKLGRNVRYRPDDLIAFLNENLQTSTTCVGNQNEL